MKTSKQSRITLRILLALMAVSTLIAIPINGGEKGWWSVWGLEYDAIYHIFRLYRISVNIDWSDYLGILLFLLHIAIFSLPFLTGSKHFRKLLIWIPAAYVIVTAIALFTLLIFLIPFSILWIITLRVWRRNNRQCLA